MKKNVLILSIICLLFCTISYTYSAFKNVVVGTINVNTSSWVFKLSVDDGTKEDGYYMVLITNKSGSFDITVDNTNSEYGASYIVELEPINLPDGIVENLTYEGKLIKNDSETITVNYSSSSNVNGYIKVKAEARKYEYTFMKNGYSYSTSANGGTEFWNSNYKSYVSTIEFNNDLSNLPSSCTEENLCWDITDSSVSNKVYGYLVDSGEADSDSKTLYNLYIVSDYDIYAPTSCDSIFYKFNNLKSIDFKNNFDTSKVTDMNGMFFECSALTSLDVSNFDTSKVTDMYGMFVWCESLTSLDVSNFDTSKVTDMNGMFVECSALTSLDLSSFNTSNVTSMSQMFSGCLALTSLDVSNFDTSNVTDMYHMFGGCVSLTSLDVSNFDTSKVTDMNGMFSSCISLTSLDVSNFDTKNVTDMDGMFCYCYKLSTTINIMNSNVTVYSFMFSNAADEDGAKITVNYIEDASDLVDKMIATKSDNSNVVKGIIIYEHTITISDNTDITYQSNNTYVGALVTLNSTSGSNIVSFKMNGTLIEGNSFRMPDTDVTITEVITE